MVIKFNASKDFTVGIELELQLVDRKTLALTGTSGKILSEVRKDPSLALSIKHELMDSNIEVITGVSRSVSEAGAELSAIIGRLIGIAGEHNTLVSGGGTHPFSLARDQKVTDDKRYNRLLDTLQFVARRFNIFGMHVHVGIDGDEKSIYVMNRMLYYLPYILALSANSPFWEGEDTGLKSYRIKVFETLPTAGIPFYFQDWDTYTRLVESYIKTGTIETIREIWWDMRPHPDFGTVEVRICDTPSSLKEVMAIAALIQALAKKFSDEFDRGIIFQRLPSAVIRENKWRACRFGIDGDLISPDGESTYGLGRAIRGLCDSLKEEAAFLGSTEELGYVNDILGGGCGASRQLKLYNENGKNFKAVVKNLATNLAEEVGVMGGKV